MNVLYQSESETIKTYYLYSHNGEISCSININDEVSGDTDNAHYIRSSSYVKNSSVVIKNYIKDDQDDCIEDFKKIVKDVKPLANLSDLTLTATRKTKTKVGDVTNTTETKE